MGHRWRRWDVGEQLSVRSPEAQRAVGESFHPVAFLVHGAVMAPAQHREIRERGGAAVGPVAEVMALAEREPATREAAAAVAVVERAPDRGRNRAGAGADFDDLAVGLVPHDHPGGGKRNK